MENCSLNVQTKIDCCLCEMVATSEDQLEAHIYEQHSEIFTIEYQARGKDEMKEDAPSLNTKSSQLDLRSSQLDLESSQLDVKSSQSDVNTNQLDVKGSQKDPKNSRLGFKNSMLDVKCTECFIRAALEKYSETVNGLKAFKCKKCAKIETNPGQTNPDRVVCHICKRDYKNKIGLIQHHQNVHIKKGKFECKDCAISLASPGSLYNHMNHVHRERKLQCHPCGKFFGQKNCLLKHNISFHSSNNKGLCLRCQKTMSLNNFPKKNRKVIDGQCVSICYKCTRRNNSNVLG